MTASPKVHKSVRLERSSLDRLHALMAEGESESAAFGRVMAAGLDALEGKGPAGTAAQDATERASTAEHEGEHTRDGALGAALGSSVDALRGQLGVMAAQLEAKDRQIEALTELARQSQATAQQAQALHAMTEARAIPAGTTEQEAGDGRDGPEPGRRGLGGWISEHFGHGRRR